MKKLLYAFLLVVGFYLGCLNYIDKDEVGIAYDRIHGTSSLQQEKGWYLTWPSIGVSVIDTTPMHVGLGSHEKTVQFIPSAYKEFLAKEGFHYYALRNFLSFNSGHTAECRGVRDIFRDLAWSGKSYTFLKVSEDSSLESPPAHNSTTRRK